MTYTSMYVSVGAADGVESQVEPVGDDDPKKFSPESWNVSEKTCNLPQASAFEHLKLDRFCWVKVLRKPAFKPLVPPQAHPLRVCAPEARYPFPAIPACSVEGLLGAIVFNAPWLSDG